MTPVLLRTLIVLLVWLGRCADAQRLVDAGSRLGDYNSRYDYSGRHWALGVSR